jgi:hypothetical protein
MTETQSLRGFARLVAGMPARRRRPPLWESGLGDTAAGPLS